VIARPARSSPFADRLKTASPCGPWRRGRPLGSTVQQFPVGYEDDERESRVQPGTGGPTGPVSRRALRRDRRGNGRRRVPGYPRSRRHLQRDRPLRPRARPRREAADRAEPRPTGSRSEPDRETVVTAYCRGHPRRKMVLSLKVRPLTLAAQREPLRRDRSRLPRRGPGEGQGRRNLDRDWPRTPGSGAHSTSGCAAEPRWNCSQTGATNLEDATAGNGSALQGHRLHTAGVDTSTDAIVVPYFHPRPAPGFTGIGCLHNRLHEQTCPADDRDRTGQRRSVVVVQPATTWHRSCAPKTGRAWSSEVAAPRSSRSISAALPGSRAAEVELTRELCSPYLRMRLSTRQICARR